MSKTIQNTEIEYKFWANDLTKEQFHAMVQSSSGGRAEPRYVVSCDDYYSMSNSSLKDSFIRYRKSNNMKELTLKMKQEGNFVRKEINLSMLGNDDSDIVEFLSLSGHKKVFSVFKEAWIWKIDNVDISYYILSDGRSIVEIEAVDYPNIESGKDWLNSVASKIGLLKDGEWTLQREKRSLFEIFSQSLKINPKSIK